MTRILDPLLNDALTALGATDTEKALLIGYLENQVASANGQIAGLRANADNASRQADELEAKSKPLVGMLTRFTSEASDEAAEIKQG